MFLGTHSPRLDEKGRLILPAKYREELAGGVVLTKGQERCLYVFSQQEFERKYETLRESSLSHRQSRDYMRVFLSGASDEVPDKQGRITIPSALRDYAGLDRELAVVGVGPHAEIWNASTWDSYLSEQEETFSNTNEDVLPGIL